MYEIFENRKAENFPKIRKFKKISRKKSRKNLPKKSQIIFLIIRGIKNMTDFEGFFLLRKFSSTGEKVVFEEISNRGVDPWKNYFKRFREHQPKVLVRLEKIICHLFFHFPKKNQKFQKKVGRKNKKKKMEKIMVCRI